MTSFAMSHGERRARQESLSRRVSRYSVVSASPAGQESSRVVDSEDPDTSGETVLHHHNSRVCHEGICALGIEREIVRHPDSLTCFDAVSLCLRLPVILLQSLSALREAGPWRDELESIYGPLFTSPPTDLFNMVLALRRFPHFESSKVIEQLELRRRNATTARKPEAGRLAPDGQAYECPSENCKKQFKKSGHAHNHVKRHHPEYLRLHSDYQPSQFTVTALRSVSGSPELQRSHEREARQKRSPRAQRPISAQSAGLSVSLSEPIDQKVLLSPSSFGLSSLGDWDDQPQLSRSRSHSRPSPRQPVTPQALGAGTTEPDRHSAMHHLVPHLLSPQAKRGRDPYSSTESMAGRYLEGGATTTTRPQRRYSKRLSTHYLQW